MARNVTVAWVYPTTRTSGRPIIPTDIVGVELSMSLDGVNWTLWDTILAPNLSAEIPDLEAGEWHFRGVVRDIQGLSSAPLDGVITVPDETAPSALQSLTVTLV